MSGADRFVIVVGLDFSPVATHALDAAFQMASVRTNAEVHVVHVVPDPALDTSTPFDAAVRAEAAVLEVQEFVQQRVGVVASRLDSSHVLRVVAHARRGSPGECLVQAAADFDADLVVVGSHGRRGIERWLLGSVAERVAHLARCPVWIVRPKDHASARLVPEIEPPCAECAVARERSGGSELWCKHHSERHLRPHRYSYGTSGQYSADSEPYASTPVGR